MFVIPKYIICCIHKVMENYSEVGNSYSVFEETTNLLIFALIILEHKSIFKFLADQEVSKKGKDIKRKLS